MFVENRRFLLCLTGTILTAAGVIFLPRHISRSLDLRNLNQVEISGREDFSFLEQGSNDIFGAVRAFQSLNQESGSPVLLTSIEEPIQMNSDLIKEVYIQAMTASEYGMLPWIRYLYSDLSSATVYDDTIYDDTDAEGEIWLNWSNYIQSAQYYSMTCTSEENPNKKELLNFWYLHFTDWRTFDYYFIVNAVNYQIYYAEIHNDITETMIREAEEYRRIYSWSEESDADAYGPFYEDGFADGCMLYYQAVGFDVVHQKNLYQKLNLAILHFENEALVYIERSVSSREDSVCQGICIGFQDLIRWVRQQPET